MSKLGKEGTKWSLMKSLNEEKAKLANNVISLIQKQAKNVREEKMEAVGSVCFSSERERETSL